MADNVIKNKNRTNNFVPPKPAYIEMNVKPINQKVANLPPVQNSGFAEFIVDGVKISDDENVDNDIIDDNISTNKVIHQFIDNNEEYFPSMKGDVVEENTPKTPDEYILMVNGDIVFTGSFDKTQELVKDIIYGESQTYKIASMDDIVVLKKLKIKVGVFLEE